MSTATAAPAAGKKKGSGAMAVLQRIGGEINLVLLGDDGPFVEARPADQVRAALDSLVV